MNYSSSASWQAPGCDLMCLLSPTPFLSLGAQHRVSFLCIFLSPAG